MLVGRVDYTALPLILLKKITITNMQKKPIYSNIRMSDECL